MTLTIQGPAWDLTAEYADIDDPRVAEDMRSLATIFDNVEENNVQLNNTAVELAQAIRKAHDEALSLLANLSTYANCLLSVDSQHDGAQKISGTLQAYEKRMGDVFEPLSQFEDQASDTIIDEYLNDPAVAPARFTVEHSRKRRHENLTLDEESLVNGLSQDGIHAWGKLYEQLSGTLRCEVSVNNELQTMGLAQATGLMSQSDDTLRENAWRAINTAWEAHEESCAASLNAIAGWRLEMCEQRSRTQQVHFLDSAVHMNRISRETLDALLAAADEAKPIAQRAANLQARAYKKDGFGPWDLRAPAPQISNQDESPIAFKDAVEVIADAYGQVHSTMRDFVHMMVKQSWIEGTVGPNKRPGAYCTGFQKSRAPRVYMTYTGGQSDVITLAHELGHALHGWMMRDLPLSQSRYGMSLAETASTFGETLVRDTLLSNSTSLQQQLDISWEDMGAFTAFLLNIPTRFEFEKGLYEVRAERPLRPQELKSLMSDAWTHWYGESLSEPDPMFWASKLHFYISELSFYNFPYLFGYLFSLGIYSQREKYGDEFFERYQALLRDTGRMTAEDLAYKHLGIDLTKTGFWQDTINSQSPKIDAFGGLLERASL